MSDFAVQDGQTFVFIGDSITYCKRREEYWPLGNGYVARTVELIGARYPERSIRFVNSGLGSNSAPQLRDRWHDDVLFYKPDWVSILIGINDVYRYVEGKDDTTPQIYEAACRNICERTHKAGAQLVLLDPFLISGDTDPASFSKKVLDALQEYNSIIESLAREFSARHVRTHDLFQEQLQYRPAEYLCPEPVHPNLAGHFVITHGLLQTLNW